MKAILRITNKATNGLLSEQTLNLEQYSKAVAESLVKDLAEKSIAEYKDLNIAAKAEIIYIEQPNNT